MGHDYIDIGAQQARYNDADIWMLRHILLQLTFDPNDELSSELREYLSSWQWLGPGVIVGSDFNSYLRSTAHHIALQVALEQAIKWLDQWGDTIPLDYLAQFEHTGVIYQGDQPILKYRNLVSDCLRMLKEV